MEPGDRGDHFEPSDLEGLTAISIADLAFQSSTGLLFGMRGPTDGLGGQGELYTINPNTGAATLKGTPATSSARLRLPPTVLYT